MARPSWGTLLRADLGPEKACKASRILTLFDRSWLIWEMPRQLSFQRKPFTQTGTTWLDVYTLRTIAGTQLALPDNTWRATAHVLLKTDDPAVAAEARVGVSGNGGANPAIVWGPAVSTTNDVAFADLFPYVDVPQFTGTLPASGGFEIHIGVRSTAAGHVATVKPGDAYWIMRN